MTIHQTHRFNHVAHVLAHLATFGIKDVAEAQHVAVGGLVEHQFADGHQGVEPAAGLIDRLADEVRRVALVKDLSVLVRVPPLSKRHRTRVVPDVDDFGDTFSIGAAVRARQRDVVDEGTVRVERRQFLPSEFAKFFKRANARRVIVFATPDRQGSTPVAISG